jgi:hypothetical protein
VCGRDFEEYPQAAFFQSDILVPNESHMKYIFGKSDILKSDGKIIVTI